MASQYLKKGTLRGPKETDTTEVRGRRGRDDGTAPSNPDAPPSVTGRKKPGLLNTDSAQPQREEGLGRKERDRERHRDGEGSIRGESPARKQTPDVSPTGTERGKHSFFPFGRKKEKKDLDDAIVAPERRGREEDTDVKPNVKPDKRRQQRDHDSTDSIPPEGLSGDGPKRPPRGHERRNARREDELKHPQKEGSSTLDAREKEGTERPERKGERDRGRGKRDQDREHGRDRLHERHNEMGQHRPETGTHGTYGRHVFDPDAGTQCERCGQVQAHCRTCQVLRRVLQIKTGENGEQTVEGLSCDECEQPIRLCEARCRCQPNLRGKLQTKLQAKRSVRKEKFE